MKTQRGGTPRGTAIPLWMSGDPAFMHRRIRETEAALTASEDERELKRLMDLLDELRGRTAAPSAPAQGVVFEDGYCYTKYRLPTVHERGAAYNALNHQRARTAILSAAGDCELEIFRDGEGFVPATHETLRDGPDMRVGGGDPRMGGGMLVVRARAPADGVVPAVLATVGSAVAGAGNWEKKD